MNKYLTASILGIISIGINVWIMYQTRYDKGLNPITKKNLEKLSYALIVAAVMFMTFG
ncbi:MULTISPECIES: hypothetical protein [Trichococcus]|uniref:Uncharacterized protein n=1 Tax=Trichococcus shcherbakoviae TaxID=2094020 RepID=A0A383TBY9_9LACT|nr:MULTISPECIES: hypothetical protein [Trichococcus]MDB6353689.1 hypothetical protein [Trichococcus sp. K1Tr]CZR00838.1 Hypothetical protein TES5_1727 [Trichococcus sp. ES5]SHF64504.1 hypothetical protein SAMN04488048_10849 [Trichococcus flocculiformis]SYZ77675.1 Hypothetical protein TART1_0444 [Trichococcus shcherbakoviae]